MSVLYLSEITFTYNKKNDNLVVNKKRKIYNFAKIFHCVCPFVTISKGYKWWMFNSGVAALNGG